MTATALLGEIEATGIVLQAEGGRVRADIPAGANLGPFRERIQADKAALHGELLQRQIVAAASAGPEHFDRERYDRSWQQWHALPVPEVEVAALVLSLDQGWDWLRDHPTHPEHSLFLERWIVRLRQYEQTYCPSRARQDDEVALPSLRSAPAIDTETAALEETG
jgi:hypothetical protein